jgi:hypothetical protein
MASEHSMGMASEPAMAMAGEQSMEAPAMQPQPNGGGHLYTQTNEFQNCVIHHSGLRTARSPSRSVAPPAAPGPAATTRSSTGMKAP